MWIPDVNWDELDSLHHLGRADSEWAKVGFYLFTIR
jgi:hypothetical protein